MADYPAVAMLALGRERVYCTFKAVENMALACESHLHTLVIIVSTDFALSHSESSSVRSEPGNHVTKGKCFYFWNTPSGDVSTQRGSVTPDISPLGGALALTRLFQEFIFHEWESRQLQMFQFAVHALCSRGVQVALVILDDLGGIRVLVKSFFLTSGAVLDVFQFLPICLAEVVC
jgi:hypothetical protein